MGFSLCVCVSNVYRERPPDEYAVLATGTPRSRVIANSPLDNQTHFTRTDGVQTELHTSRCIYLLHNSITFLEYNNNCSVKTKYKKFVKFYFFNIE